MSSDYGNLSNRSATVGMFSSASSSATSYYGGYDDKLLASGGTVQIDGVPVISSSAISPIASRIQIDFGGDQLIEVSPDMPITPKQFSQLMTGLGLDKANNGTLSSQLINLLYTNTQKGSAPTWENAITAIGGTVGTRYTPQDAINLANNSKAPSVTMQEAILSLDSINNDKTIDDKIKQEKRNILYNNLNVSIIQNTPSSYPSLPVDSRNPPLTVTNAKSITGITKDTNDAAKISGAISEEMTASIEELKEAADGDSKKYETMLLGLTVSLQKSMMDTYFNSPNGRNIILDALKTVLSIELGDDVGKKTYDLALDINGESIRTALLDPARISEIGSLSGVEAKPLKVEPSVNEKKKSDIAFPVITDPLASTGTGAKPAGYTEKSSYIGDIQAQLTPFSLDGLKKTFADLGITDIPDDRLSKLGGDFMSVVGRLDINKDNNISANEARFMAFFDAPSNITPDNMKAYLSGAGDDVGRKILLEDAMRFIGISENDSKIISDSAKDASLDALSFIIAGNLYPRPDTVTVGDMQKNIAKYATDKKLTLELQDKYNTATAEPLGADKQIMGKTDAFTPRPEGQDDNAYLDEMLKNVNPADTEKGKILKNAGTFYEQDIKAFFLETDNPTDPARLGMILSKLGVKNGNPDGTPKSAPDDMPTGLAQNIIDYAKNITAGADNQMIADNITALLGGRDNNYGSDKMKLPRTDNDGIIDRTDSKAALKKFFDSDKTTQNTKDDRPILTDMGMTNVDGTITDHDTILAVLMNPDMSKTAKYDSTIGKIRSAVAGGQNIGTMLDGFVTDIAQNSTSPADALVHITDAFKKMGESTPDADVKRQMFLGFMTSLVEYTTSHDFMLSGNIRDNMLTGLGDFITTMPEENKDYFQKDFLAALSLSKGAEKLFDPARPEQSAMMNAAASGNYEILLKGEGGVNYNNTNAFWSGTDANNPSNFMAMNNNHLNAGRML